jgi:GntR family transcriptional regulator of vanillate catabolism
VAVKHDLAGEGIGNVSNPSLTDAAEATSMLRERLLAGEFAPGSRLQQVPLAELLGISRTPLREALVTLAREGLVLYEPNRGYSVRVFEWVDIKQAYEMRAQMEAYACHRCARTGITTELAATLQACVDRGDELLATGHLAPDVLPPYRAMNVVFHESIIIAAKNRWLSDFVRQTQNVPFASDRVFVWEEYAIIKRSHDDHHRILRAILDRDGARAEALMREHVLNAGEVLGRFVNRRGGVFSVDAAAG